uniref:Uncharacterized protein n=1 Tax=Aegilops tauschii subsp. strangulata TaxID=200361 RepID=A0A453KZR3_AEGTS
VPENKIKNNHRPRPTRLWGAVGSPHSRPRRSRSLPSLPQSDHSLLPNPKQIKRRKKDGTTSSPPADSSRLGSSAGRPCCPYPLPSPPYRPVSLRASLARSPEAGRSPPTAPARWS